MLRFASLVTCLLALVPYGSFGLSGAHAQSAPEAAAYVGGLWYDGDGFAPRDTVWAYDGLFVAQRPRLTRVRTVDLAGMYIVPPFGDAHLHAFEGAGSLAYMDSLHVARGVLSVLNPAIYASKLAEVTPIPTRVDRAYATGAITAPGAHPIPVAESRALGLQPWDVYGPRGAEIRAARTYDGDAYHIAATLADVDSVWAQARQTSAAWIKLFLDDSAAWARGAQEQPSGLSPEVFAALTAHAHRDGFRVVAHIETAYDLRVAVDAGADLVAHAPGTRASAGWLRDGTDGLLPDGALLNDLARAQLPVAMTMARTPAMLPYTPPRLRPDSAQQTAVTAFHRTLARRLLRAGVPVVIGADMGALWSWDEVAYLIRIGALTHAEALRAWSVDTPRAIFPDRRVGALATDFEASFLALGCDPIEVWACTEMIQRREQRGRDADAPLEALRYTLTVRPEARRLAVEGEWIGGRLVDVRWPENAGTVAIDSVWQTQRGVQFRYVVDAPPVETENAPALSLSDRRLRTWGWDWLRAPEGADGSVTLRVEAPAGWTAATPFGDGTRGVTFPSRGAAERSPMLAGRVRTLTLPTAGGTATLAVREGHPVPDSVFALSFTALVEATTAYTGGRAGASRIFAGVDLLEGKATFAPGNASGAPGVSSFLVLQHGGVPSDLSFWGTLAHEYLHAWTPRAFEGTPGAYAHPSDGRLWPWFREGLTNYLGYRIAYEAGLHDEAEFAAALTRYVRDFADYGSGSEPTGARAYSEGLVVGLGLDVALHRESGGAAGLDDWLGLLLDRHAGADAAPLTYDALIAAAADLGGPTVADLLRALASEDPPAVREAFARALGGSGIALEEHANGPRIAFAPQTPTERATLSAFLLRPFEPGETEALRARLQAAYDAAAPFVYPVIPASAPDSAGFAVPGSSAWSTFAYGDGSDATTEPTRGALRVTASTGPSYTGAGVTLALGTPDRALDLSGYDGVEIDVQVDSGKVVVVIPSARTDRRDQPAAPVGPTAGRVTLRLPWSAFAQRAPVSGWQDRARAIQVLVRGFGAQHAAFTLHGVRLYRTDESKSALPSQREVIDFELRNGRTVEAERFTLRVPERRADPTSRLIALRFVRFPSRSDAPGSPIVYLAGGPGGSGTDAARGDRWALFDRLRDHADVIALDQRGTGLSGAPPLCDSGIRIHPDSATTRAYTVRLHHEAAAACLGFWEEEGVDIRGYTTAESAADLDAVRSALGAERISLLGISYGTHLALVTRHAYPDRIDRLVLASAEGLDDTAKRPARTDAYFDRLAWAVRRDTAAFARYGDVRALVRRVLDRAEAETPRVTGYTREGERYQRTLGRFEMQRIVGYMIADPSRFARVLPDLLAADTGDFSGFAYYHPHAITVHAMPLAMDLASGASATRREQVAAEADTALLGDALNFPVPHLLGAIPALDLGDAFREPVHSDRPTLFLSGTLDGRTYPEAHAEIAAGFSRSAILTIENAGHDLFFAHPAIVERIAEFMAGAEARASTLTAPLPSFLTD